jgi:tetratricopeptide (TPR) repeat protein
VLRPADLLNDQANIAFDLVALGKPDEARPLFLSVAEANRSAAMSDIRASYLSHAADAGTKQQAISLIESSLADPTEARSAASAALYRRLLDAHEALGDKAAASQVADRFWRDRGPGGTGFVAIPDSADPSYMADTVASICFSAAMLAQQRNQWAEADVWYQRVLEAAPNTVTAQAVRDMLARR